MTSASRMASSMLWVTRQPICSKVLERVSRAAERHLRTEFCERPYVRARHAAVRMSPRMVTFNPAMPPFFSRMVKVSSNA